MKKRLSNKKVFKAMIERMLKPITLTLLFTAMLFFLTSAAWAQVRQDGKGELLRKEKSLEDVRRKIKHEKQAVKRIKQKETSLLAELERINASLAAKKETLASASEVLEAVQKDFLNATAEIIRLENERKALNARLRLRFRSAYMTRSYENVNLFMPLPMESGDALAQARMQRYLAATAESDRALIDRFEKTIATLSKELQAQTELKRSLEEARRDVFARKKEAEASQAEKKALLNSVKLKKEKRVAAVKELETAAAGLAGLVKTLREGRGVDAANARGFAAMKGRLPRPVAGPLVWGFGTVRNPKFGTLTFNNGIFISASDGTAIKNIYSGSIAYTGWLKGYGNIIIIDHGEGYYSLFAYLQKIMKQKGDVVERGDVIGLAGSTGLESAPGLYFEIRERGVSRDPSAWLSAR